ncbi:MAG: hypothetical protein K2W95_19045 [Candidatus Obscuribacterales bacterium]|nr:hypothetical protein [Candidatus Obscuribacterales bacterium]
MGSERLEPPSRRDEIEPQTSRNQFTNEAFSKPEQSAGASSPTPRVFDENSVSEAIKVSKETKLPIISIVTPSGQLDPSTEALLSESKTDAVFVSINKEHASAMMRAGMSTPEFWSLANLAGARGDTNNIKAGFIGKFDPNSFDNNKPKDSGKPSAIARSSVSELLAPSSNAPLPELSVVSPQDVATRSLTTRSESSISPPLPKVALTDATTPTAKPAVDQQVVERTGNTLNRPKEQASPAVDKPAEIRETPASKDGPVKLKEVKFNTDDVAEAFRLARENNLPVIVYKGADFCGNCPKVSAAIDQLSAKLKSAPTTEAVVVKLNWERQQKLQQENPELAKLINQLMPINNSSFPDVKVYNPNDTTKPLKDNNGYGGDASFLESLVKVGTAAMTNREKVAPQTEKPKPEEKPTVTVTTMETRQLPKTKVEQVPESKPSVQASRPERSDPSWLEAQPSQSDKVPEAPPINEKVKLDQVKFADSELSKAVELAKANKLPIVVYTGANFCHYCPAASASVDRIAQSMAAGPETKAVVVKLTSEVANSLASRNDENGKLLTQLMSHGTHVPRVAIYNPADMNRPVGLSTVGNWSEQSIASHIEKHIGGALTGEVTKVSNGTTKARPVSENLYTEESVLKAAEYARQNNKPLISFTSDKSNPNVQKALEYLNQQKLAAAVDISKARSEQMLRAGLETRHYSALNSAIGKHPQDSSYIDSTSPSAIGADMKFSAQKHAVPKSPADMIQFLKDSGVDLSDTKHEKALAALLEGKPIPPEKPANVFKVKTPAEAEEVLKQAKEKNLPLIVHSTTTVCTETSCRQEKLDSSVPEQYAGKAIFLELPRGGLDIDGLDNEQLRSINEQFLVTEEDHKTELEMHIFRFTNDGTLTQLDTTPSATGRGHTDRIRSVLGPKD